MDSSDSDHPIFGIDDTFFDDLTHPVTKDFDHKNWNAFANDLTNACASISPPNPIQYCKVHALLLNWALDDLGTDVELQDLGTQLRSQFNFTTETWKIPSQESDNELEKKLSQVKGELAGQGNLLIVYYGGHGQWDSRQRSIWAANRMNGPTLNWSELQPMLKRASCDVLIVLDCCYAGTAGRDNVRGTKELLAACGMEVIAEAVNEYSFTRNLIDKLRSFGARPFTVSELYERLIKAKRRLRNTPQYVPLTGRDRPSIRIARLEPNVPLIMTNESMLSPPRSLPSPSSSVQSSIVSTSLASSPPSLGITRRVLLAISLDGDSTVPEVESWKRWLASDAPTNIRSIDVRIEDAYPSNSTLVFISIPISIWCHLPDTTAYRFVDFITGGSIWKEIPPKDALRQKSEEPDSISQVSEATAYPLPPSWVDDNEMHLQIAKMCIQLLSSPGKLKKNICNLPNPGILQRDVSAEIISNCLPTEVQYACRYWVDHLKRSNNRISDRGDVHTFLLHYFLYWLEAISLAGQMSESIHVIYKLQSLLEPGESAELLSFLHDAARFILTNWFIIETAPLQTYLSAIIFAPEKSIVRDIFKDHIPIWITRLPQCQKDWSPCLQTLEGHSSSVTSVAFSPDGKRILSGSRDNTVRLWDVATETVLQTFEGHSEWVTSVAFSSDGKRILSGSEDKTVRLWDAVTGVALQTLKSHSGSVDSVAFSPDGKQVVSGSGDNTVQLWDTATGAALQTLKTHLARVTSASFSPDGQRIVSGSEDNTMRLWDVATGAVLQTLKGYSGGVTSVAFSPDGKVVLTLSASNDWVAEGGTNLFWLPLEYRATSIAVWNKVIVLGHLSGRISILGFKEGSRLI